MDYQPAELTPAAVERLQALERDLSGATGDSIVVVAYKRETAHYADADESAPSGRDATR